ncbi:Transmembrane protein 205 [Liparis tanakae]|uniref:Transmembrane protein 205 n=1 Tax=Liparis tanakae TaxID=230148 RepID=A0A4Z2FHK4_9TELE|nr:Transmembrane protein 205 [Liparis tanakae]
MKEMITVFTETRKGDKSRPSRNVSTLMAKSKGFHSKYDLGVKYAEKHLRRFAPEKLLEGRNVIGLQMGTNKLASQKGMTSYGTRRHLYDSKMAMENPLDQSTISLQMGTNKGASQESKAFEVGDLVKVLHLLLLSFNFGMQIWVSYISGYVLSRQVTRNTFAVVQSMFFPVYNYSLLLSNIVLLAVYAVYQPEEEVDSDGGRQMALYGSSVIMSGLIALWCGPQSTELMFQMKEVEQEHGLGNEIGPSSEEDAYDRLWERDPKYRTSGRMFLIFNTMTFVCNLTGIICTITNLVYKALKLSSI